MTNLKEIWIRSFQRIKHQLQWINHKMNLLLIERRSLWFLYLSNLALMLTIFVRMGCWACNLVWSVPNYLTRLSRMWLWRISKFKLAKPWSSFRAAIILQDSTTHWWRTRTTNLNKEQAPTFSKTSHFPGSRTQVFLGAWPIRRAIIQFTHL